jgi:hypothetical protein
MRDKFQILLALLAARGPVVPLDPVTNDDDPPAIDLRVGEALGAQQLA